MSSGALATGPTLAAIMYLTPLLVARSTIRWVAIPSINMAYALPSDDDRKSGSSLTASLFMGLHFSS